MPELRSVGGRVAMLAVAVLVAATGCQRALGVDRETTLAVPGRSNQTPAVAADAERVVVSWTAVDTEGMADVHVSVSRDGAASFAANVRANDVVGEVRASEQQSPRVAMRGDTIAVLWTSRRNGESQVRLARSDDGGRSFGASLPISPPGAAGTRGWGSVAIDDQRRVHVLWLDTRIASAAKVPATGGDRGAEHSSGHVHGAAAAMPSTRQDVYAATVDADGSHSARLVATDVCFCCRTALVQSGAALFGAWRGVYPGSLRDISFARLDAGTGVAAARVSEDGWRIEGCPEDGPALAADASGTVHVAWPTEVSAATSAKGVFYAASADARTFSQRFRLDNGSGSASHPSVSAALSGRVLAVWDVTAAEEQRVEMRDRQGTMWGSPQVLARGEVSSPSVAAAGAGFIVTWRLRTVHIRSGRPASSLKLPNRSRVCFG